jgi:hypothetical protein
MSQFLETPTWYLLYEKNVNLKKNILNGGVYKCLEIPDAVRDITGVIPYYSEPVIRILESIIENLGERANYDNIRNIIIYYINNRGYAVLFNHLIYGADPLFTLANWNDNSWKFKILKHHTLHLNLVHNGFNNEMKYDEILNELNLNTLRTWDSPESVAILSN